MSNIMVHINMNITNTSHGVAKVTARLIPPDWKSNRENPASISLNALTVEMTTKLTLTFVLFGNTGSIVNST